MGKKKPQKTKEVLAIAAIKEASSVRDEIESAVQQQPLTPRKRGRPRKFVDKTETTFTEENKDQLAGNGAVQITQSKSVNKTGTEEEQEEEVELVQERERQRLKEEKSKSASSSSSKQPSRSRARKKSKPRKSS